MGGLHAHGHGDGPERLRSIRVALFVALALFVAKLLVFLSTGFVAVLAEALHSLTDALQTAFLLIAAKLSAAPPDAAHPFGHGRGENLAAIVVALVVVTFVAAELVRHAVETLRSPPAPPDQPLLALGVLGASAVLMVWPLVLARRDMHQHEGVVRAQAVESVNDLLGVLAAMAGVAFVMAGYAQADAVAALLVAAIIIFNAIQLFRVNMPYLVGASPPQAFYARVEEVARGVEGALGVHSMAAEYIGPTQVHLDMSLTVPTDMSIDDADEVAHRVRHRLGEEVGVRSVAIHFCTARGELRRHGETATVADAPARLADPKPRRR